MKKIVNNTLRIPTSASNEVYTVIIHRMSHITCTLNTSVVLFTIGKKMSEKRITRFERINNEKKNLTYFSVSIGHAIEERAIIF